MIKYQESIPGAATSLYGDEFVGMQGSFGHGECVNASDVEARLSMYWSATDAGQKDAIDAIGPVIQLGVSTDDAKAWVSRKSEGRSIRRASTVEAALLEVQLDETTSRDILIKGAVGNLTLNRVIMRQDEAWPSWQIGISLNRGHRIEPAALAEALTLTASPRVAAAATGIVDFMRLHGFKKYLDQ